MTDDEIEAHKMMQPARDAMAREELRDKFAMAALSGMLAQQRFMLDMDTYRTISQCAYYVADVMLEARKAKP